MNRRFVSLLMVSVMVLTMAACKKEEEPTMTTFPEVPGVALVPDDFWDESEPAEEATPAPEATEAEAEVPEETKTAEEDKNTEETKATEETKIPEETEDITSETQEPTENPADTVVNMTQYEWYHSLSGEQQMAYMETFDNMQAFFDWYNAAKEEHEKEKPGIDIGSGNIDMGDIIGGNG